VKYADNMRRIQLGQQDNDPSRIHVNVERGKKKTGNSGRYSATGSREGNDLTTTEISSLYRVGMGKNIVI
jgi:hypothetical protein